MYTRPENADSAFKWEDLMLKNNSELLANLGNFVNRALKFTKDNFEGIIGKMSLTVEDKQIIAKINRCLKQYIDLLEKCREREAITQILNISRIGNQFMQAEKPWKLIKNEESKNRAHSVVSFCANISCLLAILVEPYMPHLSREMFRMLNIQLEEVNVLGEEEPLFRCFLKPGHVIGKPEPLIKEIKPEEINILKQKFAGRSSPSKAPEPSQGTNEVNKKKKGNKKR